MLSSVFISGPVFQTTGKMAEQVLITYLLRETSKQRHSGGQRWPVWTLSTTVVCGRTILLPAFDISVVIFVMTMSLSSLCCSFF